MILRVVCRWRRVTVRGLCWSRTLKVRTLTRRRNSRLIKLWCYVSEIAVLVVDSVACAIWPWYGVGDAVCV